MRKLVTISQDLTQEVFTDAFRCYVGRGKFVGFDQCAEDTGIPVRTLRAFSEARMKPRLDVFLTLASYLPAGFTNKMLAPTGKGHVADLGAGTECALEINECASRLCAEIGSYLVDSNSPGRIDHFEAHKLDKTVDEVAAKINEYRAARSKAKLQVVA